MWPRDYWIWDTAESELTATSSGQRVGQSPGSLQLLGMKTVQEDETGRGQGSKSQGRCCDIPMVHDLHFKGSCCSHTEGVEEGVRSKKTGQGPEIGHLRNTSGMDPKLVLKDRARQLWDTRMTVCGMAGKQAPRQDEVSGWNRGVNGRGRLGENKVPPTLDVGATLISLDLNHQADSGTQIWSSGEDRAGDSTVRVHQLTDSQLAPTNQVEVGKERGPRPGQKAKSWF